MINYRGLGLVLIGISSGVNAMEDSSTKALPSFLTVVTFAQISRVAPWEDRPMMEELDKKISAQKKLDRPEPSRTPYDRPQNQKSKLRESLERKSQREQQQLESPSIKVIHSFNHHTFHTVNGKVVSNQTLEQVVDKRKKGKSLTKFERGIVDLPGLERLIIDKKTDESTFDDFNFVECRFSRSADGTAMRLERNLK